MHDDGNSRNVSLFCGDCLDVLKTLPDNSVDSCVTDPPYHLTSIVQRFGAESASPSKSYKTGAYGGGFDPNGAGTGAAFARMSRGFMGQKWDGGDIAFRPDVWREVLRVLKPGGHLLSFGGTRTYHRMACAIEDAGFEVRDCLQWLYGSGFPKSRDMSKAIDKRPGVQRHSEFAADLRAAMASKGYTNTFDVAEKVLGRRTGAVANWQKYQWPEARWWPAIRDLLGMDESKWGQIIAEAERNRLGGKAATRLAVAPGQENDRSDIELDVTEPATAAAREWSGWGTALKPACEMIVLARKPLSEKTVAANVLRWGTGALNIDGCRVATGDALGGGMVSMGRPKPSEGWDRPWMHDTEITERKQIEAVAKVAFAESRGRWPANVVHDGSPEVVGMFPESSITGERSVRSKAARVAGTNWLTDNHESQEHTDSGSAARFFYQAKADDDDRLGSRHPTIKPVALMQWLVRLVTPPRGLVLDPFAGSGTTGEAAFREGVRSILIEREAPYCDDIRRRTALAMAGVDERSRASMKVKMKDKPPDHGPLFAEAAE